MSRLLRGLEDEGLIETTAHGTDARRRIARLTPAGRREFNAYEAISNRQAEDFLARHAQREALLAAMDMIASAFGRDGTALQEMDPRSDEARCCLGAYYAELARRFSQGFDVKLSRELVLIGKQFLYVERYMKLLAPRWQMMSDPQLTGYFANFMVEVSREHQSDVEV